MYFVLAIHTYTGKDTLAQPSFFTDLLPYRRRHPLQFSGHQLRMESIHVDIDPDDSKKGTVEYKSTGSKPKGLFVTTYYFRDKACTQCKDNDGTDLPDQNWAKTDIYKPGLLHYLKVTEAPEFAGWKLLIYTDQQSFDNPIFRNESDAVRFAKHKAEWDEIANHPNVMFGIVNWPEYSIDADGSGDAIDNAILRMMRMKALHDFPEIPVFVRDADTLFENLVKVRSIASELTAWEFTLWENLRRIFEAPGSPYKILIASQPNYHRQWHVHPETGQETNGCYAAVTSTLGSMKGWTDGTMWRACLAYVRKHTQMEKNMGGKRASTTVDKPSYIGIDEQLLSYVVIAKALEQVYFYYLEYIQVEGTKIVDGSATKFAPDLIAAGFTRYPSPYMESLGEAPLDLESSATTKRKDANEKTEETILDPKSIPLALADENQKVMQLIFKYFNRAARAGTMTGGYRRTFKKRGRGHKRRTNKRSSTKRYRRR
jgi:hypothetical protein